MSSQITFTSARLLSFGRNQNIGTAQFVCSWNQRVAKSMGWGDEIPSWEKKSSLDGELHATSMKLTPSEAAMKKHELEMDINLVYGFEAVRLELEGSKGKGFRTEVRFKIDFTDPNGCKLLERYIMTLTDSKGSMSVSYTPQAVQEALPLSSEADQAQGTLENQVVEIIKGSKAKAN
jgi:alkyl sulfatase BDS1-like metallo-beta-lactamase superfamily hydrolase